ATRLEICPRKLHSVFLLHRWPGRSPLRTPGMTDARWNLMHMLEWDTTGGSIHCAEQGGRVPVRFLGITDPTAAFCGLCIRWAVLRLLSARPMRWTALRSS